MNSALLYPADPLHAELGDDFLDVVEAATFPRLELSYFDRDRPCTLLIDEIESIWKTEFDWTSSVIRSRSSVLRLMVSPFRASRGSLVALAPPPAFCFRSCFSLAPPKIAVRAPRHARGCVWLRGSRSLSSSFGATSFLSRHSSRTLRPVERDSSAICAAVS